MSEAIMKRLEEVVVSLGVEKTDAPTDLRAFYKLRNTRAVEKKRVEVFKFSDTITIVPLGDIHFGHSNANYAKLKATVDYISKTPNCYTVLLGDIAETATKTSVGAAMFEEEYHIPQQLDMMVDTLTPLASEGKVFGVTVGNHEVRVAQTVGLNPMEIMARELGIPYLGYQGYVKIQVGSQNYHVMLHHGAGGGSTTGAKANAAEKLNKVAIADLYLSGHTHSKHFTEDMIYQIDDNTNELVPKRRVYVACGSFLEYWGGYAEMKCLPPTPTGVVHIELRADIKDIRVNI